MPRGSFIMILTVFTAVSAVSLLARLNARLLTLTYFDGYEDDYIFGQCTIVCPSIHMSELLYVDITYIRSPCKIIGNATVSH